MNKKANLFIAGTMKAGTTSLYSCLAQHPKVYMSAIKEPHFFCKDITLDSFHENYRKRVEIDTDKYFSSQPLQKLHAAYLSHLPEEIYNNLYAPAGDNCTILGEASVGYMYSNVAACEIKKYNPDAKVIFILRHPVKRTISHYCMDFASGGQCEPIMLKALQTDYYRKDKGWGLSHLYLEASRYREQVKRFTNVFNSSQLLILDFEDLKADIQATANKVFAFLALPTCDVDTGARNPTMQPRNGSVKVLRAMVRKIKPNSVTVPPFIKKLFLTRSKVEVPQEAIDFLEKELHDEINYYNTLFSKN